jgi:hypothetical protein
MYKSDILHMQNNVGRRNYYDSISTASSRTIPSERKQYRNNSLNSNGDKTS